MLPTYELITSQTLGSDTASVTFSSIPATYDDLYLSFTWRSTAAGSGAGVRFNGDTGSNYSYRALRGNGSSVDSFNSATWATNFGTAYDEFIFFGVTTSAYTSNTFASGGIYMPNYAGSTNKSVSIDTVAENNSTTVNTLYAVAGLWSSTTAITSVGLIVDPYASGSPSIASGSSFYLFGIREETA